MVDSVTLSDEMKFILSALKEQTGVDGYLGVSYWEKDSSWRLWFLDDSGVDADNLDVNADSITLAAIKLAETELGPGTGPIAAGPAFRLRARLRGDVPGKGA